MFYSVFFLEISKLVNPSVTTAQVIFDILKSIRECVTVIIIRFAHPYIYINELLFVSLAKKRG